MCINAAVTVASNMCCLEEQVNTEWWRKESCQGEIEQLSRQLQLAEGKPSHWEEAARDIHILKHQQQRKGSKDQPSSVALDPEGTVGDGTIEVHVQMAKLKGCNSELHSRVVSLEHKCQVLSKLTLDERNIVIEALRKELMAINKLLPITLILVMHDVPTFQHTSHTTNNFEQVKLQVKQEQFVHIAHLPKCTRGQREYIIRCSIGYSKYFPLPTTILLPMKQAW